jgi:hypothetical protein
MLGPRHNQEEKRLNVAIKLSDWHAKGDERSHLNAPFNFSDLTIATNGEAMISVPKQDGYPDVVDSLKPRLSALLNTEGSFSPLDSECDYSEKIDCPVCGGSKSITEIQCIECSGEKTVEFENDHSRYTCDCDSCNATGRQDVLGDGIHCDNCDSDGKTHKNGLAMVKIDGVWIEEKYYNLLLTLSDLSVSGSQENRIVHFKSGTAVGVVMGSMGLEDTKKTLVAYPPATR